MPDCGATVMAITRRCTGALLGGPIKQKRAKKLFRPLCQLLSFQKNDTYFFFFFAATFFFATFFAAFFFAATTAPPWE
jgi:hypothetical protein